MSKKNIIIFVVSLLAILAGFFWYFTNYLKKKTTTSPQTGNIASSQDSSLINTLKDKVDELTTKNLIIYSETFALIPVLDATKEVIVVVRVDETKGNVKSTYLHDVNGLTLISTQEIGVDFEYITPDEDGVLTL